MAFLGSKMDHKIIAKSDGKDARVIRIHVVMVLSVVKTRTISRCACLRKKDPFKRMNLPRSFLNQLHPMMRLAKLRPSKVVVKTKAAVPWILLVALIGAGQRKILVSIVIIMMASVG